jgi:hypothetical protein
MLINKRRNLFIKILHKVLEKNSKNLGPHLGPPGRSRHASSSAPPDGDNWPLAPPMCWPVRVWEIESCWPGAGQGTGDGLQQTEVQKEAIAY